MATVKMTQSGERTESAKVTLIANTCSLLRLGLNNFMTDLLRCFGINHWPQISEIL